MLTPEERAARKVGGSTIAKIVKQSKWGTPLDAYLELRGERAHVEKTGEDIDRGTFLEPSLLQWASKKIGKPFAKPLLGSALPSWDWATVSPDGLTMVGGRRELLEIKAPRRDDVLQWGEEHSDEVPTDALLQTHWGIMVTDSERGYVAALLGGELRIFRIERDRDMEAKLLSAAQRFVADHVLPGIPPPPEWGDDHNVLYMHPRNTMPHREWSQLTEQEKVVVREYIVRYADSKTAEKSVDSWAVIVKEMIGDTAGINGAADTEFKRLDWKLNQSAGTKWKELATSLMAQMPVEEQEELKRNFAGQAARVFRPYFTKEK